MKRMIYVKGRVTGYGTRHPFGYWINADHITYVAGKDDANGCLIKLLDRESVIDTDEHFDDVMEKVRNA